MAEQPMNEAERQEMARAAFKTIQQAQRVLEGLGIPLEDKKPEPIKAPDGGPTSKAHTFIKPKVLPTRRIKFKDSGEVAVINSRDFDPDYHEPCDKRERTRLDEDVNPEPRPKFGTEDRDVLLTMTVPSLQAMPEVKYIEGEVPDKKGPLVEAIIQVRDDAALAS